MKKPELPPNTELEVVARKEGQEVVKTMTYKELLKLLKKGSLNGWKLQGYQKGFRR